MGRKQLDSVNVSPHVAAMASLIMGLVCVGCGAREAPNAPEANTLGKMSEHHALLELLPGDEHATHVAAVDGEWSSTATWSSASVPGEGAIVRIPAGIAVRYSIEQSPHLFLVRVDGKLVLEAPNGRATRMVVDTLYSTKASEFEIDASSESAGGVELELRPFDIEAFKRDDACDWNDAMRSLYSDGARVVDTGADTRSVAELETIDDGPGVLGRYGWDPHQLSLGLVLLGPARIVGQQKRAFGRVAGAVSAGDRTVALKDAPTAWAVGDTVVFVGTRYVGRDQVTGGYLGTEDELRTIERVEGSQVMLDHALEFDHAAPRADLDIFVANLTRNVRIKSGIDIDLEHLSAQVQGDMASTLGHVMFMHSADVEVRQTVFDNLGRTNKNDAVDDFLRRDYDGLDAARAWELVDGVQTPIPILANRVTNPRGRYALHLHRAGATGADAVALVEGCVATGGPGWGFVSHDSRANFFDNVTFGVLGAAFVAEAGNETGTWRGNLAINTYGADFNSPRLEPKGLFRFENEDFEPTILIEKRGSWKNHDFGHYGDGFWLQGKLIEMEGNIAANSGLTGYFYMFRAPDQIFVRPETVVEPASIHDPEGVHPFAPGLHVFKGNRSIADRCGLVMMGMGGGRTNDERSILDDFAAWEVGQVGTYAEYYPGYTIRDSRFIASESPGARPTEGIRFHKVQVDTVLANTEVVGFPHAYDLRKSWSPGARNQAGFEDPYFVIGEALAAGEENPLPLAYAHVLIDVGFGHEGASDPHNMGATYRAEDTIISADDLDVGRFSIEFDDSSLRVDLDNQKITYGTLPDDPVRPTLQEGHVLLLRGTKTDSIGTIPIDYHNNVLVWHAPAVQHRLETEGYFHMPAGQIGVMLEEVFSDRYTGDRKVVRFVAELDSRWSLAGARDQGTFDPAAHPDVYCPRFLLD